MKTAIASALVIMAAMSSNSFAQGTAASPKPAPKIESNMGKVVTLTPKQKNHFWKKHQLQDKEQVVKKSGS